LCFGVRECCQSSKIGIIVDPNRTVTDQCIPHVGVYRVDPIRMELRLFHPIVVVVVDILNEFVQRSSIRGIFERD
jgi:hypothetical protein